VASWARQRRSIRSEVVLGDGAGAAGEAQVVVLDSETVRGVDQKEGRL
jgi:hypothetical protein